jgi:hypothetical protein
MVVAIVALVVLALLGWLIHRDGIERGKGAAKLVAVDSALKLGAVRVMAAKEERDEALGVAEKAVQRSIPRVERYMELVRQVRELPDSALAANITLIRETVDAGDSAVMATLSEAKAHRVVIAADSAVIRQLEDQHARKDRKIEVLEDLKSPRCGTKCGIAIGATVVTLLAVLLGGG